MSRQTIIVGSATAWHHERLQLALHQGNGIQIFTVSQLFERLAGGFLRSARRDEIQIATMQALESQKSQLRHLSPLADLPGTATAVCDTLRIAWASGFDLSARTEEPRSADLHVLETFVVSHLPPNALIPRDLLKAALARIHLAPSLIGSIRVQGVYALAPCWQPLFAALAERIPVEWEMIIESEDWLSQTQVKQVKKITPNTTPPLRSAVSCANPTHEITEALRWARQLITTGRARPQDIAIAAASLESFDDHLRVMRDESELPLHFTDGCAALSVFAGQQAAALAELLLHGVSQDRILRSIRLIRREQNDFTNLPGGWDRLLMPDAPLLTLDHWRRELDRVNDEQGVDLRPGLLSFVEDVARGLTSAEAVGERWLKGRARGIWRKALVDGPASALATALNRIMVGDERDPTASILWGTASVLCTVRRRFVRLVGLSSRGWPRSLQDNPLLPEHILGKRLAAHAVPDLDRLHLSLLTIQADEVVFSRSRRDKEGRLLGISPLFPRDIQTVDLRQSRVPPHAFSHADRLLARSVEFAQSDLANSAKQCRENRNREDLTIHDGLVRPGHPVIAAALDRVQSATSLRMLLRDPLGFVWKYALWLKQPEDTAGEEPIFFDDLAKGSFIHELLEQTVNALEEDGGFSSSSPEKIGAAIAGACRATAMKWELRVPVPAPAIWERMQQEASRITLRALTYPHEVRKNTHSFVEVPFGNTETDLPVTRLPWDPTQAIQLPGSSLKIKGRIDRLDLSDDSHFARVIDYKTIGKTPKEDPFLNGGKELQRAIYSCVVRSLLPRVNEVEAELLYPDTDSLFRAEDVDALVSKMVEYTNAAVRLLKEGCALPGIGAEDPYNEMRFVLPSNALGFYFPRKAQSRNARMQALLPLWGI